MEHLAIDLGGSQSQICIRSETGEVLVERRCRTADLAQLLAQRPPSRVVVETCAESFAVADAALAVGHQVRVVPSTLVRSLGVGARRTKNDRRDAQVLSEVSCRIDLPSVHIPSQQARQWKSLCGMRDSLVGCRTTLINSVRGWLRGRGFKAATGASSTFSGRVRACVVAELPTFVARQLDTIDALTEQIHAANREVYALAHRDATCRRLMTVPGIGVHTALRFVATLDEVSRFADGHRVASYLGLVPGEWSSSERERRLGITKAGSTSLRWALVQSAWAALRSRRQGPLQQWCAELAKRRGQKIAVTALARKLAGILFAIWRDGTVYQAERAAMVVTQE